VHDIKLFLKGTRVRPHSPRDWVTRRGQALPGSVRYERERFEQVSLSEPMRNCISADFHSVLAGTARSERSAAAIPKALQVRLIGRENANAVAVRCEMAAQALEERLRTPKRRRISLDKMSYSHGENVPNSQCTARSTKMSGQRLLFCSTAELRMLQIFLSHTEWTP
jgi:hypothetical protein